MSAAATSETAGVGQTILLALPCTVYPPTVAGLVAILAHPSPLRGLIGYLLGGMLVSVALGIVIVDVLHASDDTLSTQRTTKPVVDIVAGLVSLSVAWAVATRRTDRIAAWRDRRRPATDTGPSRVTRVLQRQSAMVAFGAGVLLNLPSLWYLAALTDIAADDISFATELARILVFNLVMFVLVESVLGLYFVSPARAQGLANGVTGYVRMHARSLVIGLAAVVGAGLVAKGVVAAV
jgi:Sap-like sulfolipid-1-addressing protein